MSHLPLFLRWVLYAYALVWIVALICLGLPCFVLGLVCSTLGEWFLWLGYFVRDRLEQAGNKLEDYDRD